MSFLAISRTVFKDAEWGEKTGSHGKYKIKVNTQDPFDLTVKVVAADKKYSVDPQNIKWQGIEGLSKEILLQFVLKAPDKFSVKIIPPKKGESIYSVNIELLKSQAKLEKISAPGKKTPRIKKLEPTLLNCANAATFVRLNNKNHSLPSEILHEMVNEFCNKAILDNNIIQEITLVIGLLSPEDLIKVIEKLAQNACTNILSKEPSLNGLTEVLSFIYRKSLQEAAEKAQQTPSLDPQVILKGSLLSYLNANHLVRLMEALTVELSKEHTTPEPLIIFLRTSIAILDVMMVLGVTGLDREGHHEKFVDTFSKFSSHEDCRVAFLAKYGEQCFTVIKNDESRAHAFFRRAFSIFKGLATIGESIELERPWAILGAVDSINDFKEAFAHLQHKYEWFKKLRILQEYFLQKKNSDKLRIFLNAITGGNTDAQKSLPGAASTGFHFFVCGLVNLLDQVITTYEATDSELVEYAINLLKKIRLDNEKKQGTVFNQTFKTKDKYTQSIIQEINRIILKKEHSRSNQNDSPSKLEEETELFTSALKSAAPWIEGIRNMEKRVEEDPQVVEEWEYSITLKGKDSDYDNKGTSMDEKISKALADERNKVVILLGNSGSGKSLYSKLHVLQELDSFNLDKPLSLYISMNTIQRPDGFLMEEILSQLKMEDQKEFLQKNRIWLFIDSYDEWFIRGRKSNGGLINLYDENHLSEFWPKLQLIVMCRRDFLQKGDSLFFSPKNGNKQELLVAPFLKEDVENIYLPKYIKIRLQRDLPLLWNDAKKYVEWIEKLKLWDIISNPFNLRVMSDTLPSIVNRHTSSNKAKSAMPFKVEKEDLFDEFICQRYHEEFARQREAGTPIRTMIEYLQFACEITRNMQYCNIRSVGSDAKDLMQARARDFIKEQKKKIEQINQAEEARDKELKQQIERSQNANNIETLTKKRQEQKETAKSDLQAIHQNIQEAENAPSSLWKQLFDSDARTISLRRACLLIRRDGHVEFIHDSIYGHFRAIDGIREDKERILKRIQELESKEISSSSLMD